MSASETAIASDAIPTSVSALLLLLLLLRNMLLLPASLLLAIPYCLGTIQEH